MFTNGDNTIVARATITDYVSMVNGIGRYPDCRIVTVFAHITGLYVCGMFTGGLNAIMAIHTVTGDVHVVEVRRSPSDRRMTIVTGVAARYVRRVLAGRRHAVVA